jgi:dihydrodipicolinate synthase/N-acetylneuraminate lyase
LVEDRQAWDHSTFVIDHADDTTVNYLGPVKRRAVYFKQLAKFCFDAGCKQFQVLPNIMFKPPFKKHTEHIIIVDF